ncbi:MAG: PaaI family thioesterase [Pseudomonadota bacterium]
MSIPTVLDRFPIPPCATLLGLDIIEACRGEGVVKIAFTAQPSFCNAAGNVQGGFLSAMLDDCMGPAILIASNAQVFPSTIDLYVQFLAPAKPGTLIGTGRVVQLGRTIGFVEAELADVAGTALARGRASVRLTALPKAVA